MNPEQVSNSVRGAVLAVSSLLLLVANVAGVPLLESDVMTFATQLGSAAGALWFFYGLAMKVVMRVGK